MSNIKNYYDSLPKKYREEKRTYHSFPKIRIPIPFTMLIVGRKGSMKTNAACAVRDATNCWGKFYIFAPTLTQPLYKSFIKEMDDLGDDLDDTIVLYGTKIKEIPPPEDFDKTENNLLITDDFSAEDMSELATFSVRHRHNNISHIHVCHNYFGTVPLMRRNTDVLILKGITSKRDLKRILLEFQHDYDIDFVMKMVEYATRFRTATEQPNFFMFHNHAQDKQDRYRKNFDPIFLNGNEEHNKKVMQEIESIHI